MPIIEFPYLSFVQIAGHQYEVEVTLTLGKKMMAYSRCVHDRTFLRPRGLDCQSIQKDINRVD